jgi:hypothetical protein
MIVKLRLHPARIGAFIALSLHTRLESHYVPAFHTPYP